MNCPADMKGSVRLALDLAACYTVSMIHTVSNEQAKAFAFSNDAEEITFQKMRQLMAFNESLCLSDEKDLLFVRTGAGWPAWIYTRKGIAEETMQELAASLCVLKEANNLAGVIGRSSLVRFLELALPFPKSRRLPLTAYIAEEPKRFTAEGERVPASELDPAACGKLLAQLGEQVREPIPEGERLQAGRFFCGCPDAYGWCVNGTPVALVRMSQQNEHLRYINSVVTDEAHRRHGYAKALVSAVCADAHAQGFRTMLYADTSYPPSNALYRAVGFTEAGRLIGFDFL